MPDTYTYKSDGACEIKLDVYAAVSDKPTPIIVTLHGGGLIVGSRQDVASQGPSVLREMCTAAGYTQVAIDYRLAPETPLQAIVQDLEDAWRYLHAIWPSARYNTDTSRIALLGRSAGAYLALLGGVRLTPRPSAIVSFYGYGDITEPWYRDPSEFYRTTRPIVTEDEAHSAVGTAPISESPGMSDPRGRFYLYCRQQGRWVQEVTGLDPLRDAAQLLPYRPIANVDASYPPALLLHGTADTDVPYEASTQMHAALQAAGAYSQLVTLPDAGHVFDYPVTADDLTSATPSAAASTFATVIEFLKQHL
jgi:acetyl esterase/lipase